MRKSIRLVVPSLCLAGPLALLACDTSASRAPGSEPVAAAESAEPASADPASAAPAPAPSLAPAASTLIPRRVIFGPDHLRVRVSPDGTKLGWLAPVNGVRNVWVAPAGDLSAARPVTQEVARHIHWWDWSPTGGQVLYTQDRNGDENTHVYWVDLSGGQTSDLTPGRGVRSTVETTSLKDPRHVVIGQNARDPRVVDLHLVDVTTGENTLLAENEGDYSSWTVDNHLKVTGAHRANSDGSLDILVFDPKLGTRSALHVPFEDIGNVELLGRDRGIQYMKDSRGRGTSALVAVDTRTGASQVLAEDPRTDVASVLARGKPLAVSFNYEHTRWQVLDPSVQADLDYLESVAQGDLSFDSHSTDDKRWVVSYRTSNQPRVFYLYDRGATPGVAGRATLLFSQSSELARLTLPQTVPVVIPSRDGLGLVSYVTVPISADPTGSGKPIHPMPMVLWVHGGPQERDTAGFDDNVQWLANRGYVMLKVNFRGSTALGKTFLNAGNGQYGGTMQNDLLDAVAWAVRQGIADPAKIAILGHSYGGYAALTGLTSTPDTFACGVDVYGMPNLVSRLQTIPYTLPSGAWETRRVGDPKTAAGQALLLAESPIAHVASMRKPLLVFQGANDPRVLPSDVDTFVAATKPLGLPVTYVVYPDEGHGFSRPENVLTYAGVTEVFLAQCLGGSYEALSDDMAGSSLTVPWGAENVRGLQGPAPSAAPRAP